MHFVDATFVIIGGGIAGVTCAETVSSLCPEEKVVLVTESTYLKIVSNLERITKCVFKFVVEERDINNLEDTCASTVTVIVDTVQSINPLSRHIYTSGELTISYRFLCICTGARPKLIQPSHERVLGIRDTDSVLYLQKCIKSSRKVAIVGNGGIANELAYELRNVDIHWIIRSGHIASTFLDPGAAEFFQTIVQHNEIKAVSSEPVKRLRYTEICETIPGAKKSAALGPDWQKSFPISGAHESNSVKIYHNAEILTLGTTAESQAEFPIFVTLTTGERIECDYLISATGVEPCLNFSITKNLALSDDGFILVDSLMRTNIDGIYAAGDICSANWNLSENWFQMRLWTQARQMGAMAGRSMAAALKNEEIHQDFCFELFGHVTKLYGFDVVLLGCFNGQKLGTNYEIILRRTPGEEYVKLVLCEGKLRGAILIGNTELAETCENLILNGLDISALGENILDPDVDIEDFFD